MKKQVKTLIVIAMIGGLCSMAPAKEVDQISPPVTQEPLPIMETQDTNMEILVIDTSAFALDAVPVKPQITLPELDLTVQKPSLGDSLFTASLVTLAAANIADYFSTREALKHPGLKEANPLMKPFVEDAVLFAGVKLGISALNTILLKNLYKKNKTLAWIVCTAANIAMSYAVFNNIGHIRQAKSL